MFLSILITLASVQAQGPAETIAERAAEQVLGAGTRFETSWFDHRGPEEGPTVLILGGMHGNEPAGPAAADAISNWTVKRWRQTSALFL
jgi:predicted deacylase